MQAMTLDSASFAAHAHRNHPGVLWVRARISRRTFRCMTSSLKGLKLYTSMVGDNVYTGVQLVTQEAELVQFIDTLACLVLHFREDEVQLLDRINMLFEANTAVAPMVEGEDDVAFVPVCRP